jgi:putative oxidoreductase
LGGARFDVRAVTFFFQLELVLQRLFSTFADGWPGLGLIIQRFVTAAALFSCAATRYSTSAEPAVLVPYLISAGAGLFLLLGLWTPIAGYITAAVELWVAFSSRGNPTLALVLAASSASLAMIGPGAWSIDARLFGRKHISVPRP